MIPIGDISLQRALSVGWNLRGVRNPFLLYANDAQPGLGWLGFCSRLFVQLEPTLLPGANANECRYQVVATKPASLDA
jgi:hypothetical protein